MAWLVPIWKICRISQSQFLSGEVSAGTSNLTDRIIDKELSLGFKDFEDSLQYDWAVKKDCKIIDNKK